MMVTSSGSRVEFRQDAASGLYEAADSSYAQLSVATGGQGTATENVTLTVKTTDGTQMIYTWKAGAYRLNQIKDRNGNFISVVYDDQYGLLQSVTDTLGRIITVEYDIEFYPVAIKQNWQAGNGSGTAAPHTYVTFTYTAKQITPNFNSTLNMNIFGPAGGAYIKVLEQIVYPTGARTVFEYNDYGQVKKVRNLAADLHELNYVETNLPDFTATTNARSDCPHFTETRSYVENFNEVNGIPAKTIVHNELTANGQFTADGESLYPADVVEVYMDNDPHNVHSMTYHYQAGNWAAGLTFATADIVGGVRKRWTHTVWTQNNTGLNYIQNPRVTKTKVGDETTVKETQTDYYPISPAYPIALVKEVRQYDKDRTRFEKRVVSDYKTDAAYLSRRIIGLPAKMDVYGWNEQTAAEELVTKTTYGYDQFDFSGTEQNISSVIRHDNTNYGAGFITGRGNLTTTTQCDAALSSAADCLGGVASQTRYNTAGAAVKQSTPDIFGNPTREVKISYADSFNDTVSRNTFAYPTVLTTAGVAANSEVSSFVQYRYEIGANVWAKSPSRRCRRII